MGLIERIKSALGLGTAPSSSQSATSSTDGPTAGDGVDVTVEHDPATASEDAVKGTDTADDDGPTAEVDTTTEPDSPSVDEDADTSSAAAEPDSSEVDGTGTDETDESAAADADGTSESDESKPAPTEPAPDAELEDIKGIGPAYGERLREAGIEGIGDLADADAAALAAETDIAESRVADWVEQAKLY